MKRLVLAASALAALASVPALAGDTKPAPAAAKAASHPHFNDGGTLSWSTRLADAQKEAKKAGKLIFIEFGREA